MKTKNVLQVKKDENGVFIHRMDMKYADMMGLVMTLVTTMADVSKIPYNEILDDMRLVTKEEEKEEE
jgi:hypothetical protein